MDINNLKYKILDRKQKRQITKINKILNKIDKSFDLYNCEYYFDKLEKVEKNLRNIRYKAKIFMDDRDR